MNEYLEKLRSAAKRNRSILCMGIDPCLDRVPKANKSKIRESITGYFIPLIEAAKKEVGAIKPNYAFFGQYGFEGLEALEEIISAGKKAKLPLILDAKRADVGQSSEAYAREVFDFWKADATTVAPYMGSDAISPYLNYCRKQGKGAYILCRTSNKGAEDFQLPNLLYLLVARKIIEWHTDGAGAVVGATSPAELSELAELFSKSGKKIPLLIPGVGTQGGSAAETAKILAKSGSDPLIHRINASSSISYAYLGKKGDPVELALAEIRRLNSEIGLQ